MYIKVKIVKP